MRKEEERERVRYRVSRMERSFINRGWRASLAWMLGPKVDMMKAGMPT